MKKWTKILLIIVIVILLLFVGMSYFIGTQVFRGLLNWLLVKILQK